MKPLKRKTATAVRLRRRNFFLEYFVLVYEPKCFFCLKNITTTDFTDYRDNVTLHHKNHNHNDDRPTNWTLAHRGCHRSYHQGAGKVIQTIVNAVNAVNKGIENGHTEIHS